MRVDNPEHNHDHAFGLGAEQTAQDVSAGEHTTAGHGLFEHLGADSPDLLHDPGHLEHDFGQHHDTGFDGLHDSVHAIGLGFGGGGEDHHGLHDSFHDSSTDPSHHGHVEVDTHHDVGLGGEHFHHG
jgi:hypothetical protein